ncbi:MAG: D-alanine--D-alanine ligase [Verrucomicrobiota bacterium]|nr:D-alanine--D-alanine ligase [Verrucomicrobiota bacterium]
MNNLKTKHVAVLMGGFSTEREVSLRTGAAVSKALRSLGYQVTDVDIQSAEFELPKEVDAAFIALHGSFGEDGAIQKILEGKGIAYTGANAELSEVAFDKLKTKDKFVSGGVPTPGFEIVQKNKPVLLKLKYPVVVKPPLQGSSIGIHIVMEESQWKPAMDDAFKYGETLLIEDYCKGREITVGILGGEVLPGVEVAPKVGFYDYTNKYTSGASEYLVPAPLSLEEETEIRKLALMAYKSLGNPVYGRVDFILDEQGRWWVLELNTIPGMTETSLLPKAAAAAGISFPQLCERILELSLQARLTEKTNTRGQ